MASDGAVLHADEPIESRSEDLLGRVTFADRISDEVLRSPAARGFVIAVTGEWGSGKTSVLKLVAESVAEKAVTLWFNPWLFSTSEELVSRFFAEFAAQMAGHQDQEVKNLAECIASYGKALAPVAQLILPGVGTLMSGAAEALGVATDSVGRSTRDRYVALSEELARSQTRFVVFIDDIDRLRPDEIGEVMRLVKLVGDLPNVVYVLAYDRRRVEDALGAGDLKQGRAYLEKVVQVAHTMPALRPGTLHRIALEELQAVLGDRRLPFFDDDAWGELFRQGIAPMIRTLRDARRYANVAPLMASLVGDEVAGQDLLALEALRVFEPDVHAALRDLRPGLTGESGGIAPLERIEAERREALKVVLEAAGDQESTTTLLRLLFPPAGHLLGGTREEAGKRSWRVSRRVASGDVFDVYLHASFGEEAIATADVLKVVAALADEDRLRALLAEVPDERLNELLDRVQDYGADFRAEYAGAAAAFLHLMPRLRLGMRWSLFPPEWAVKGVLSQFLGTLPHADRPAVVDQLFDGAPYLTARWFVIMWFGHSDDAREQGELRVLTPDATERLWTKLREEILKAEIAALVDEPRLLTLMGVLIRGDDDDESRELIRGKLADDRLFEALLVNALQYSDWWRALIRLVGEEWLKSRVAEVDAKRSNKELGDDVAFALERARARAAGELDPFD
jgi:predicted KAP-like P-loop ATPase